MMRWIGPPIEPRPVRHVRDEYDERPKIRTVFSACPTCEHVIVELMQEPDYEPTPFLNSDLALANKVKKHEP